MNHFALTIVGRDRAGIVSQVSSILGGQFAMILILGHPKLTDRDSFGDAFKPLEDSDLSVSLRVLKPGGEIRSNIFGDICMISVYGSDKPGIVYRVAQVLGEKNINITDLNTKSTPSWSAAMNDLSM
jgi:glycine cleavage system transcriptional repressor